MLKKKRSFGYLQKLDTDFVGLFTSMISSLQNTFIAKPIEI